MQSLASRPKRTLGALAVVLAAVGITVGSGATFSAQSANVGNSFATGTLTIGNTPGVNFLTLTNLKPGQPQSGVVDIANTGSIPGDFSVTGSNFTGSAVLRNQLDLVVEDCGVPPVGPGGACPSPVSPAVYSGKISSFNTPQSLGNFASGDVHRYRFTVTLPSTGVGTDNAYQGLTAGMKINWDALQS